MTDVRRKPVIFLTFTLPSDSPAKRLKMSHQRTIDSSPVIKHRSGEDTYRNPLTRKRITNKGSHQPRLSSLYMRSKVNLVCFPMPSSREFFYSNIPTFKSSVSIFLTTQKSSSETGSSVLAVSLHTVQQVTVPILITPSLPVFVLDPVSSSPPT